MLNKKFSKLPEDIIEKISSLRYMDALEKISDNIFDIECIDDIRSYF